MTTTPLGMLVATTVIIPLDFLTGLGRGWLIRNRKRTTARTVSEIWATGFQLVNLITLPILIVMWSSELSIERDNPQASEQEILFLVMNPKTQKLHFTMGFLYALEMYTLKAAFLALFYDLKANLSRSLQILLYAITAWTALTFCGVIVFNFAYCRPLSLIWSGKCATIISLTGVIVTSWTNITTDLGILLIGVMIVVRLQVHENARRALWIMPGIGSISLIATLVRFVLSYQVANEPTELTRDDIHQIYVYGYIEVTLAWMAFAIPVLRFYWNSLRADTHKGSSDGSTGNGTFMSRMSRLRNNVSGTTRSRTLQVNVMRTYDVELTDAETSSQTQLRPSIDESKAPWRSRSEYKTQVVGSP